MSNSYVCISDVVHQIEIVPESTISRTIYQDDDVKTIVFGFAQGQELSEHTASMPAIIHVLQGEARITLGDDVIEAQPNTWVSMAPGLPHSIVAKTPVVMLLMLLKRRESN